MAHAYNPSTQIVKKEKASLDYIKLSFQKLNSDDNIINSYTREKVEYRLLKTRQIRNTL